MTEHERNALIALSLSLGLLWLVVLAVAVSS